MGDNSALPKLLALAGKGGPAADAARQSITALPGKDVDAKIISLLRAEKDAKTRAEYVGIVAARRSAGAAAVLLEEAKYSDAAVRGRAMAELTPLASPADLAGLIEGVLAAQPGEERDAAERTVVRVMQQVPKPAKRAELVIAAINSAGGDHLALLPLAGRFGGKVVAGIVESDLAGPDPHVKQLALRALCNWPDASLADELVQRSETCTDPADRSMLLRAYIRVVSLPKQGTDAVRLERLKRAMALARHDEERAYILQRAGAVRTVELAAVYTALRRSPGPGRTGLRGGGGAGASPRAARPEQGRVPGRLGEGAADQQGPADSGEREAIPRTRCIVRDA